MPKPRTPVEYIGPMPVDLSEIDEAMRPASEMRAALSAEAIEDYAGTLAEMPPVKLLWDGEAGHYWVVDGAHTLTAFAGMGQRAAPAMVADGTYLMAFELASRENTRHGVRVAKADKRTRTRRACESLMKTEPDWPWTSGRLAALCNVSDPLANEVLKEHEREYGLTGKRTGSTGRQSPASVHRGTPTYPTNGDSDEIAPPSANGTHAVAILPEPRESPRPAPQPSPFFGLRKILEEVQVMIGSVNAPADEVHHGWGGFPGVAGRMNPRERMLIRNELETLVESLQEWLATMEGNDGASQEAEEIDAHPAVGALPIRLQAPR